jgi:PEP-CTERM motif
MFNLCTPRMTFPRPLIRDGRRLIRAFGLLTILMCGADTARAGVIFGFTGAGLTGGYRWDADPLTVNIGGTSYERSLDGGLRYSLESGSYEGFRDMFSWSAVPTVDEFVQAIGDAFGAWTALDPVTGLGTALTFIADLGTPVEGTPSGGGLNNRGAEIDILASLDASLWNPGNSSPQAETFFTTTSTLATLTSGTTGYAGARAISGADITINNNPGAVYSLEIFRRLLTHEIGHAIGLGDVEGDLNPGAFVDDNFDATSSARAQATLTNSWAALVNPIDPASSPLRRFTVPPGNPGTTTPGVDLLMESRGLGIGPSNPVSKLVPLTNDEFGTRQFLYPEARRPSVPEPASLALLGIGIAATTARRSAMRRHARAARTPPSSRGDERRQPAS